MTALLDAPAPPAAVEPRRPVRRWLAAALVGLLVVGAAVLATRPPALAAGASAFTGGAPVTTLPSYGPKGMHVLYYQDKAELRITLPLRNRGVLPVTVTSADLGPAVRPLVVATGTAGPVTVWPGQERDVVVNVRLDNCAWYHEREVQTFDAVRVGYEVLGRSGTRDVALDRPLMVRSPMIIGCPDRKLDRSATNRTGPGRLAAR